jgi:flagella basal body P-ring formation protein FlgA
MKPALAKSARALRFFLVSASCLFWLFLAYSSLADENATSPATTNQTPTVRLRPSVQVDSEGVFLDQVIDTGAELPKLRLCDPPACGKVLCLKKTEVAELARVAGLEQSLTNWAGPELSRVSRRMHPLSEKQLLQLLTSSLQQHYIKERGELELRLTRPWTPVNVPDEPLTLEVLDLPTVGVTPAFIARFEFATSHEEHLGSWQAAVQAKVWREVWVARSPIKRGESVHGADLVRERRDMLVCREPLADLAADDSALEFAEPLQAGTPLFARLIRPRPIVHRGQSLAAMVQDGALLITLKVEALEDGALGQLIRVRNPLSRRDLHAKVVDEQNVLVSL